MSSRCERAAICTCADCSAELADFVEWLTTPLLPAPEMARYRAKGILPGEVQPRLIEDDNRVQVRQAGVHGGAHSRRK